MHLPTCIYWVSILRQTPGPGNPNPSYKPLRAASSFINRAKTLETWQWLESPSRIAAFRPKGTSELPGRLIKHRCRAPLLEFLIQWKLLMGRKICVSNKFSGAGMLMVSTSDSPGGGMNNERRFTFPTLR